MIPMSELIKDKTYKKFLMTQPLIPPLLKDPRMVPSPPWVVYVQKDMDGPWGKKEFWKYTDAFKFFRKWLKRGAHDLALNNKRYGYEPPNRFARIKGKYVKGSDGVVRQATKSLPWRPKLEQGDAEHHWCKYCRRPTVFKFYSRHKRIGVVDQTVPRCCICGASARIALSASDNLFRKY